jgi:hypothetical protein
MEAFPSTPTHKIDDIKNAFVLKTTRSIYVENHLFHIFLLNGRV